MHQKNDSRFPRPIRPQPTTPTRSAMSIPTALTSPDGESRSTPIDACTAASASAIAAAAGTLAVMVEAIVPAGGATSTGTTPPICGSTSVISSSGLPT